MTRNPWLEVSADEYRRHMEHDECQQGAMLREHFDGCLRRFAPRSVLFLGAGLGNGLEAPLLDGLDDVLAVDLNNRYLSDLKRRFGDHSSLRTRHCHFPDEFRDEGRFDLAYGALFFEYVDAEPALATIARHLEADGRVVALLQQPSPVGHVADTGVASLARLSSVMSLHSPEDFSAAGWRVGLEPVRGTPESLVRCGKTFTEVLLRPAR